MRKLLLILFVALACGCPPVPLEADGIVSAKNYYPEFETFRWTIIGMLPTMKATQYPAMWEITVEGNDRTWRVNVTEEYWDGIDVGDSYGMRKPE